MRKMVSFLTPARIAHPRGLSWIILGMAMSANLGGQPSPTFRTLAGVSPGNVGGSGTTARFRGGGSIAVDVSGDLFVADSDNDTIRKVTSAGIVTTLAGAPGMAGTIDGAGPTARFNAPAGIAVDGSGNVYVADYGNNTIRKITPEGVVSTLAGAPGNPGPSGDSADGTGSSAGFFHPGGLAVDISGNVFVSDTGNGTIRKISPAGVVTTIAGVVGVAGSTDGTGTAALFEYPSGMAIDGSGNLYVADDGAKTIRKVTPTGTVTTLAGTPNRIGSSDGTGASASFTDPLGIAVDASGNAYVADNGNDTIRKVTPAGVVTTLAGSPTSAGSRDGTGSAAGFTEPYGVAVNASGTLFVTDDTTIRMVTAGGVVSTLAGVESIGAEDGSGSAARFSGPVGVAVDGGGNAYVTDTANNTVRKITPAGAVTTLAGSPGVAGSSDGVGGAASFNGPNGIAVDPSGNVYVADTRNNTIRKITAAGIVSTLAGSAGNPGSADGPGAAAGFRTPFGVAVDSSGDLFVSDSGNDTIRRVTADGLVSTFAGSAGLFGSTDGSGASARFSGPGGLAIGRSGSLAVTDNNTIRMITPAGIVSTIAGTPGVFGGADGQGPAASFRQPTGVCVDAAGNVFVADSGNDTIREISPAGGVTTVAGIEGVLGSTDGAGGAALFAYPTGVAVDGNGILYVADNENNAVRISSSAPPPDIDTSNAWLGNLSARAYLPEGAGLVIAGFVTTGPGAKSLLIRADGPALAADEISDFLPDPRLTLFSGQAAFAQTESWKPDLVSVFSRVGAFPLGAGSHDDALLQSVAPGPYTAQVASQASQAGVVLAEIYDADSGAPANRLVNISARAEVGTGANILIGGFVVEGTTDEALLIRAVGPALGAFGVSGALEAPVLTLFNSNGAIIASNTGWGSPVVPGSGAVQGGPGATVLLPATAAIFSQVGAFSLPAGSADSAMVVELPVGSYTAQVSGLNGGTGVALVEIYEIRR
jgi:sugar lactone lactonase YvrE